MPRRHTVAEMVTAGPTEDALTSPGVAMGTVAYMSPEQARGEELDVRTDLFSFGAVLYEMATGRQAFYGATTAVIHDAILNRAPLSITSVNPQLPTKLEEIINRLLEKDPELRYQSAADLRSELKRLKRDTTSGRSTAAVVLGPVSTTEPSRFSGVTGAAGAKSRRAQWPLWRAGSLALILSGLVVAFFLWRRPGTLPEVVERQVTANPQRIG